MQAYLTPKYMHIQTENMENELQTAITTDGSDASISTPL